jgi:hypothetical protein
VRKVRAAADEVVRLTTHARVAAQAEALSREETVGTEVANEAVDAAIEAVEEFKRQARAEASATRNRGSSLPRWARYRGGNEVGTTRAQPARMVTSDRMVEPKPLSRGPQKAHMGFERAPR